MGVSKTTAACQVTEALDRAANDLLKWSHGDNGRFLSAESQWGGGGLDWLRVHLAAGPVSEERREDLGRSLLMVATLPPSQRTERIDGSVVMMMAIMVTSDGGGDGAG